VVVLELPLEDAPIPRKEGSEDKRGERGAFSRGQWEGERYGRVQLERVGLRIVPPTQMSLVFKFLLNSAEGRLNW